MFVTACLFSKVFRKAELGVKLKVPCGWFFYRFEKNLTALLEILLGFAWKLENPEALEVLETLDLIDSIGAIENAIKRPLTP